MRRVWFWAIALISLLFVVGESFLRKAIAVSLCGILGFNSSACSAYFLSDHSRANAALPPVSTDYTSIITQGLYLAQSQNSNIPNNPPCTAQITAISTIAFGAPSVNKLSDDTFELGQSSPEGCQYKTTIKKTQNQIYQESVRFISPSVEACGVSSFTARFNPEGTRVELQTNGSSGSLIVQKIDDKSVRATYKDSKGETEIGKFPIQSENTPGSNKFQKNSEQERKEKLTEALCKSGRQTAAGLATIFTVGAVLGAALAVAAPVTTALAGGTALTLGAFALTGAIVGYGSYFMFGGTPPIVSRPKTFASALPKGKLCSF